MMRRADPPVGIVAAMLALAMAAGVGSLVQHVARYQAARHVFAAAGTPAVVKSKTLTLQRAAAANDNLLPIYGSSELYCCGDPYRPTELFASQPTGFQAFDVGRPGFGNLLFTEMFGALGEALAGRKIVVVDSPPWFAQGERGYDTAYDANFSLGIATRFVFDAPISLRLRETAARRLLLHPQTLAGDTLLRLSVQALARPTRLRLAGYAALAPLGRLESWLDESRDAVATLVFLRRHDWRRTGVEVPRTTLDWETLAKRATTIAERRDTNNPFGFPDEVFDKIRAGRGKAGVERALATLRAGASNRDGDLFPEPRPWVERVAMSPQWADLRLAIAVLRELGAQPLFMTVPMPGFFDDYTRRSWRVRAVYYDRWERTMERTRTPWLDFRADEEDRYFTADPGAHLSPRGWIFADRALDMFWHDRPLDEIRTALADLAAEVPSPTALASGHGDDARQAVQ